MKKFISILAWTFVTITSLFLILTMLSTYNIINISYFNNYYVFQSSIVITMILWSIKQIPISNGRWTNSILCMFMGIVTMVFMCMKIY
ncbi:MULTISPECIES: hypothetical protein [Clostridium]|nr:MULTISPECIES: hypothetical protein [Clostridium]EGO86550.1 hypothetical protein CBCST_17459 [Clostridium botulinum C str. Stockholm]EES92169.1 conserved hypothetical protein [Clostridium botulinum D str. 1873]KEI09264.1 hypothetical protein Z957_04990 [Clostridium sp. K25]KEI12645.1 hypothetical protein Z958_06175 [Clostridium novyi B str. NCTC 9691]KEI15493.1 hypothetical protein Z959_00160 [Clostridium novyi B str. ATCC 27606]